MERRLLLILMVPILGLGAYLRLADLGGPSLWLDEILHHRITESLADVPWYRHLAGVREIASGTENGPLYYRLQIWGQRLAPGDVGTRLFPALVGIATIPLMALAGLRLGGPLVGLAAAGLLAVSPLHVYYSREGRPYYLLMALALLLLYALLERGSRPRSRRTGVSLAWAGCLLAAYVGLHSVPVVASFAALSALALGWSLKNGTALGRSPYLHYTAAASLALALAYGLYMTRSHVNTPTLVKPAKQVELEKSPQFQSPLSPNSLKTFLASVTTSGHPSVPMVPRSWVLTALALAGLAAAGRRRRVAAAATAAMFLLPATLSFAALVATGRSYTTRYTGSALPAFLLLTALGIAVTAELTVRALDAAIARRTTRSRMTPATRTAATWGLASVLLLLLVAPNLADARTAPTRKLDWRGVARFFDAVALPDEPVLVPNMWPQVCLGYYLEELGRRVEFVHLWESAERGEAEVRKRPRGWLLTAGFRRTNEVRAWMHGYVPVLKKREKEMDLFFFPDFVTLVETRFAAHKGAVFEEAFRAMDQRFDFAGDAFDGDASDGDASLLQGRGWSYPESNNAGITYRWAFGELAELALPIGRPRDATLRLRVLPFTYPESPTQRLETWLGDAHLATLDLPPGWSEHQVEVPAAAWSHGANILTLRFAHSASPAAVSGGGDHRELAAAFDYLEVRTAE